MNSIKKSVNRIYRHLADEKSKKIFGLRYMYYLTNDDFFLRETVMTIPECWNVHQKLKESKQKKYIFGAGMWGGGF